MPSKEKKTSSPFSPETARRIKKSKSKESSSSDLAENLVESNKGLLLRPGAMAEGFERATKRRMRPVGFHINISCKAIKITVEEPLEDIYGKRNH